MAEPTDLLLQIAADHVASIRGAWLSVVRRFLARVSDTQVASVLRKEGYYAKASDSIDSLMDILDGLLAEDVVPKITDVWLASGRKVSSVLPKGAIIAPFSFDTARVAALSSADGYRASFIRDISQTQRETVSQVINRGFVEGRSRSQVARDIRASIGLTWKQEQWIENYRNQLSSMDSSALERMLRDKRSDRLYQRMLDSGGALSPEQIDSMVERYRQRMIKWRAETIARTESVRAMRMGEWDTLMAAHDAGALSPLLRRFWVVTADERLRRYHMPIPSMNAEGRAIDEAFQTPLGLLMYPLDPNGVAANVINCRCRVEYRMPTASGEYKNIPVWGRTFPGLEDLGDIT